MPKLLNAFSAQQRQHGALEQVLMTLAALEGKELQAAVGVGIKLHRSAMRLALAIGSGIAAGAAFAGATGVTTAGAASPFFWKIEPVRAARCLLMTWPLVYVTEYLGISTRITARIDSVIAGGVSMITRRTPALRIVSIRSGISAIDTVAKSGSYVSAYS